MAITFAERGSGPPTHGDDHLRRSLFFGHFQAVQPGIRCRTTTSANYPRAWAQLQILQQPGTGGNVQETGTGNEHPARKGGRRLKGLANEYSMT